MNGAAPPGARPPHADCIAAIHGSPTRAVVAVTGGGVAALQWLLSVPGASRTMLEGTVPYAEAALRELVGGEPDGAVSVATAAAMASACRRRAVALAAAEGLEPATPLVGVAATAALVSDRPKRGAHRAHVGLATAAATTVWTVTLDKGARDRIGEDAVVADLVIAALAAGCAVAPDPPTALLAGDEVTPGWPAPAHTDTGASQDQATEEHHP